MSQSRADTQTSDTNMATVASQWPTWNHHHPPPTPPDSPPDPCDDLRDLALQFTKMPLQPRRSRRNLARYSTIDLSDIEDPESSRSPRPFRYSGGSVTTVSTDKTQTDAPSLDTGDNLQDVEFEDPPSPTVFVPAGGECSISNKGCNMDFISLLWS